MADFEKESTGGNIFGGNEDLESSTLGGSVQLTSQKPLGGFLYAVAEGGLIVCLIIVIMYLWWGSSVPVVLTLFTIGFGIAYLVSEFFINRRLMGMPPGSINVLGRPY